MMQTELPAIGLPGRMLRGMLVEAHMLHRSAAWVDELVDALYGRGYMMLDLNEILLEANAYNSLEQLYQVYPMCKVEYQLAA